MCLPYERCKGLHRIHPHASKSFPFGNMTWSSYSGAHLQWQARLGPIDVQRHRRDPSAAPSMVMQGVNRITPPSCGCPGPPQGPASKQCPVTTPHHKAEKKSTKRGAPGCCAPQSPAHACPDFSLGFLSCSVNSGAPPGGCPQSCSWGPRGTAEQGNERHNAPI